MPYVNPRECTSLPFTPPQPLPSGLFAVPAENHPIGYRRIAPPQAGRWTLQPKYDLYRVIINTAGRGAMFNQVGLTMPEASSGLYKEQLRKLCALFPNEWIDAFIRNVREGDNVEFGQGAILVNDIFLPGVPFWERQGKLGGKIHELGICRPLPHRELLKVPNFPEHISLELWAALKDVQASWSKRNIHMYNGIVAKAIASEYTPRDKGYTSGAWMSYPFSPVLTLTVVPNQSELALTAET